MSAEKIDAAVIGAGVVGLAVARAGLEDRGEQVLILVSGALVATTAYVAGSVLAPAPDDAALAFPGVPYAGEGSTPGQALAQLFLSPRDHSSSVVDVVGTAGVAVAVIALCLLVFDGRGRVAERIAFPLAAVGSMPLTVYSGHLVVIAMLPTSPESVEAWGWFALGSVVFAMLWRRFLGRGPLERVVGALASLVPMR